MMNSTRHLCHPILDKQDDSQDEFRSVWERLSTRFFTGYETLRLGGANWRLCKSDKVESSRYTVALFPLLFVSMWSFIADIVNPPHDTPSSVVKFCVPTNNVLETESVSIITPPILNTATSKNVCPLWQSNPKLPALEGRIWGIRSEYSDTSANEDNSFRNHIR